MGSASTRSFSALSTAFGSLIVAFCVAAQIASLVGFGTTLFGLAVLAYVLVRYLVQGKLNTTQENRKSLLAQLRRKIANEGKEVVGIADRILVLSKGRLTGDFDGDGVSEQQLVEASYVGHTAIPQVEDA